MRYLREGDEVKRKKEREWVRGWWGKKEEKNKNKNKEQVYVGGGKKRKRIEGGDIQQVEREREEENRKGRYFRNCEIINK